MKKIVIYSNQNMDTIFDFIGTNSGDWQVLQMQTIIGEPLETVSYLNIIPSTTLKVDQGIWTLKGIRSNLRYTEKDEKEKLTSIQADLGRNEATYAAMIPMRKNKAWWDLAQDERRKIFENQSHHTQIGLDYLPAIARRLFHSRDIAEPFDFITWFEYAPEDAPAFDELLLRLRASEEWKYVDREVDIRLRKNII
jgi:chlorite dismutase